MSTIGITATLLMGGRSLSTQRAAIEIIGHNISNVNTPNYARQRVPLKTDLTIKDQIGQQGIGAFPGNIEALRSTLLDAQIPGGVSIFSYLEEKSNLLNEVTASIGQPLDTVNSAAGSSSLNATDGLAESLDSFFNAWQSLSTDPTSTTLRQQVTLSAQSLARKLNSIDTDLRTAQGQIITQLDQDITDINNAATQIADLNKQIAAIEVGGLVKANDLRDTRQQAIEDLSKKIDLFTQEQADGTVTVRLGSSTGALLVNGVFSGNTAAAATVKLGRDTTVNPPNIAIRSWTGGEAETNANLDPVAPQPTGGTVAARIEVINTVIGASNPGGGGLIRDFDRIAAALAALVNPVHAAGFNLQGSPAYSTNGNATFFDNNNIGGDALGTVTAANIQLNSTVAGDVREIAASDTAGEPLNGANAVAIDQLRNNTTGPSLGGLTVSDYYRTSLTSLATNLHITDNQKTTQDLLNQQLNQQRDSLMGVSVDEEMTNLIRFQNAYAASARFVTTIDEMMQTTVDMKR